MPFLFREMAFCECGRPTLAGSHVCRTCYEDGLRRTWREEFHAQAGDGAPEPMRMIPARLRPLFAPTDDEQENDG